MMNSASKSLYKRTLSENVQVPVRKPTGRRRFAMIDAEVLADRELPPAAKLAFEAMTMESYSSGQIAISHQAIARLCGIGRITVLDSLKRLVSKGLIEKIGEPQKQIQRYKLNVAPARSGSTPVVSRPKPTVLCPKCRKLRGGLLRVGVCRSCSRKYEIRTIAREVAVEEIAKTA